MPPPVDTDLTPQGFNPTGGTNPLGTIAPIVNVQGQLLQQQLFRQQMVARQRAGAIIAASPPGDWDHMVTSLQADPLVAGVLPDIFNSINTARNAMLTGRGQVLDQNLKGMNAVTAAAVGSVNDPSRLGDNIQSVLKSFPPDMRKDLTPATTDFVTGLMRGITGKDPIADKATYQRNLIATSLSAGLDPAHTYAGAGAVPPQFSTGPYGPGGATTPIQIGGVGGNIPSAPSGPTQSGAEFNLNRGKAAADYRQKLDDTTQMGGQIIKTLQPAWEALQGIKAGGGANLYQKLGELAQVVGAPDDLVNRLSNGSLPASQEFQKLMVNTTMGQIAQQLPAMSHLAVSEFNTFQKNNPNIDTDPRAIEKIFNFWSNMYKQNHDEQTSMDTYLSKPGADPTRWPAIWQDIAQKKGYINTNITGSNDESKKPRPPIESFFK